MSDPETEITIVSDIDKGEYIFRVPSLTDQLKIGFRARAIRRKFDPDTQGSIIGIDNITHELVMAIATFELQLRAGPLWVYGNVTPGPDVTPVVDSEKFPSNKEEAMVEVYRKYGMATERFRVERSGTDAAPA